MSNHILFILVIIINIMSLYSSKTWYNKIMADRVALDRVSLERIPIKYIIFKEKTLKKFLKSMKNKYDIYHNKSIASIAEGIISYNELSEDQKTLIEVVISLCY